MSAPNTPMAVDHGAVHHPSIIGKDAQRGGLGRKPHDIGHLIAMLHPDKHHKAAAYGADELTTDTDGGMTNALYHYPHLTRKVNRD